MKIDPYLELMAKHKASDLFMTTGAPANIKRQGEFIAVGKPMQAGLVRELAFDLMDKYQKEKFAKKLEMNLGLSKPGVGRFRVNVYMQRGEVSLVVRFISSLIPSFEALNLPAIMREMVMYKSGLVLIVGSTGSGKSTSLAAMIDHRNTTMPGHILTIEDPIEFTFTHKKSIVGQREVGIDTHSYNDALREAMREAPDVIMIGEIRDQQTMQAALAFADTGQLVISTLHAVNANQALDRIVNFFSPEARNKILQDLSLNLRGIASLRLLKGISTKRIPAVEVLLNSPYVSDLIARSKVHEIKEIMEKSNAIGMQTFDQSLYALYDQGMITRDEALENADSRNNLEWRMNFGGGIPDETGTGEVAPEHFDGVMEAGEEFEAGEETNPPTPTVTDPTQSSILDDLQPFYKSKLRKS